MYDYSNKRLGAVTVVEPEGMFRLDGIVVTHERGSGDGVVVKLGGTFIMYSGEISSNDLFFMLIQVESREVMKAVCTIRLFLKCRAV